MLAKSATHDHNDHEVEPQKRKTPKQGLKEKQGLTETSIAPELVLKRAVAGPPRAVTPKEILVLQHAVGNKSVQQMMAQRKTINPSAARMLQTKLTVNPPGDRYEQEADLVAKQLTNVSSQKPSARMGVPEQQPVSGDSIERAQPGAWVQRHFSEKQERRMEEAAKRADMSEDEIEHRIYTSNQLLEEKAEEESEKIYGEINKLMFRKLGVKRIKTTTTKEGKEQIEVLGPAY